MASEHPALKRQNRREAVLHHTPERDVKNSEFIERMESRGIEPLTSAVQGRRSPN